MSVTVAAITLITEQDYLEGEKQSEGRHEFVDGQVYAMAGASKRHVIITGNIFAQLRAAAKGSDCIVYQSDMKVRSAAHQAYYYPDVVVACAEDDASDYYLEKPCLIVEVLSHSTEKRDRREKLLAYMTIPTVQAYLLIAQDQAEVELFYREANGSWWVMSFEGLEANLHLPCPPMTLNLADIYDAISF